MPERPQFSTLDDVTVSSITSELRAFCARMEQNALTQGVFLMAALARYSSQTLVGHIGKEGQERLTDASVAIIGCGALGTVLANNLCRGGIGRLVIADRDYIELNNLQRQILFDEDDIARRLPKAIAAAEKLQRVNSETKIETLVEDINADGVESLVKGVDLVLDATDNFETRYLLNDVCVKYGRPWIYSGVIASYGDSTPSALISSTSVSIFVSLF